MKILSKALPLLACFIFLACAPGGAATLDHYRAGHDELAVPTTALISPAGARLEVTQKVAVSHINGHPAVQFVLPANAANLQLAVPGHTIARWSSTPVLLDDDNPMAGRRAQVEKEKAELDAALVTVNARIALWQALPKSVSAQDMSQLQSALQSDMPRLALEQASLQRRLNMINEELMRVPQAAGLGERVRVILTGDIKEGSEIELKYAYNHDGCGWEAVYDFNARPDEGSGDVIDVRMLAEVWQFTGIDWKDTEIILATHGHGPRQPAPLAEWVVDSDSVSIQPRTAGNRAISAMKLEAAAPGAGTPAMASVTADTDGVYASWKLAEKGLPQGRTRVQITSAAWRAPLQWLARPSLHSSQVWLMAKYDLPADQAWPVGIAEYSVDGQSVGSGEFRPRGGEATLYFGADPRVSVATTTDARTRGESGFIRSTKTWTWSWIYTISNQRNKPIKVRVERPAPMIVDQNVTVTYKNDPQATMDEREHMLYWVVDVPAHGKTEIKHSVTLSSPTKLPLSPDIP